MLLKERLLLLRAIERLVEPVDTELMRHGQSPIHTNAEADRLMGWQLVGGL